MYIALTRHIYLTRHILCWTNKRGERLIPLGPRLGCAGSTSHLVYYSTRVYTKSEWDRAKNIFYIRKGLTLASLGAIRGIYTRATL